MKGQVNVYYAKGLFKNALVVGAGFVVGKYLGNYIAGGIDGASKVLLKHIAKKGNETAQEACKNLNIEYEDKPDENSKKKITMGFHCE